MYQPYDNEQNIFQQIGLVSISCIGQQLQSFQDNLIQGKLEKAFKEESPPVESTIDQIQERYGKPN